MAGHGRRVRRADNAPTVLLQGRVDPAIREKYKEAAEASGVSVAYYLEALAKKLAEKDGSLPLVDRPHAQGEELPLRQPAA